jgi:hypothetical protein
MYFADNGIAGCAAQPFRNFACAIAIAPHVFEYLDLLFGPVHDSHVLPRLGLREMSVLANFGPETVLAKPKETSYKML